MNKAAAKARRDVKGEIGVDHPIIPIVSASLFDSTDLMVMEAEMLDRIMGAELATLFRTGR